MTARGRQRGTGGLWGESGEEIEGGDCSSNPKTGLYTGKRKEILTGFFGLDSGRAILGGGSLLLSASKNLFTEMHLLRQPPPKIYYFLETVALKYPPLLIDFPRQTKANVSENKKCPPLLILGINGSGHFFCVCL